MNGTVFFQRVAEASTAAALRLERFVAAADAVLIFGFILPKTAADGAALRDQLWHAER